MTIDHAIAPSQLMAEIAEIDVLLMHYEDWRALLQLESREKQGDAVRSINGDTLKALLLESLSINPLFARRQMLLAELEKIARDLQRLGPRAETPEVNLASSDTPKPLHDDLSKISGIDARLAKRLNILNVRSFRQIANWTPDDVEYVGNTLGLDQLIVAQDWIGQAAQLVQLRDAAVPASDAWVHARNGVANVTPAPAPISTSSPGAHVAVDLKPAEPVAKPETVAKPVATPAVAPAAAVPAPPKAVPGAKPELPTPAPAANAGTSLPARVAAAVLVTPPTEVDVSWKKLVPALPLAARNYKTEGSPPAALQETAKAAPVQSVNEPVNLPIPTMPLAARHYQGAVLEPKHDGAVYSGLVPAKPLPAPAYRTTAPVVPAMSVVPAAVASPAPPAKQTAAAPSGSNDKAADILQHTLPPLPLRPSAHHAPPPIDQVNVAQVQSRAQSRAQPPAPAEQPAAAAVQSEALLLAVVAARSPLVVGASPPPIPSEVTNGKAASHVRPASSQPVSTGARPAQVFPAVAPPPMRDDAEPRSRQASVEARVTIKRSEEALPNPVLRSSGGTEVYLGARRGTQADEFDGTSYAAYRGSIEEASVQIVRRPPAAKTPDAPPPLTSAVVSAAQATAKAVEASRPPMAGSGAGPGESVTPGGSPMGRFLKALTGQ